MSENSFTQLLLKLLQNVNVTIRWKWRDAVEDSGEALLYVLDMLQSDLVLTRISC